MPERVEPERVPERKAKVKARQKISRAHQPEMIEGLTENRYQALLEDGYFRDALENDGIAAALGYLANARHIMSFSSDQLSLDSLCEWGLEPAIAQAVIHADPSSDHLEIEYVVVAALAIHNHADTPHWDGLDWPSANRPIEQGFLESPTTLFMGRGAPDGEVPREFIFTAKNDVQSLESLLPAAPKDRFLVYHACSWFSMGSISTDGISLMRSENRVCDFGTMAFYVTPDFQYARWWALRPLNYRVGQQAAIAVFSIPISYKQDARVLELSGSSWETAIRHYRKNEPKVPEGLESAQIIEGPVCKDVSSVNSCKADPIPLEFRQMAFKDRSVVGKLELEKIIIFKKGTKIN